ncbi:CDP-alcohol phosphatidyltransferase family protein [Acinetobacter bereziniae]|jgi:CDP-diacylglycerol--glycerol-3-phosphate 3-phosphatidyltransferase|uniref:CDP-alcohol phosphatidyltransferase family protein n=1 Tax=Acinetobacter TaxID=469 RepID=UPI0002AEE10E|nr:MULTISPECIES: CDP-alcohol phosphatidyltransferase family protein [Acinetobacter]ELW86072.1 CDP-alcohol phosphatidyltransferase [Acinetobacter sp. WC-743]KKW77784.1 CDP-alcohol phosphatidyltransferase [Acinetobacter sp. Ag2]MBJ8424686.1 CDP-alcohol phosphatidyltransferase family protein [Acinetobacter bereziniae]MBJ8473838.1 CDP-alcohol phosphatidyltransferase family protein [Acinetobacter bereziniae]MBJ9374443.1 CDP-alcohol phosphatidyltransferase family protein [Acinetobacter sp. TGL-Y2]
MPSIYQLKPAFQNLLRPLVQWLFKRGVTANQVTLFAMFISLALSIFLYLYYLNHPVNWWLLLFPLWMLIRMAFNAIDGMLAREFNQQSNLGAFYNELSDVIADTALYVCLIAFAFIHAKLLLLVAFLAILSEYTGVMAPLIGQQRRYDGPMGKSDRAFWFSLITVVIVFFPLFNTNLQLLSLICNGILSLMGVLLALTIYNRIKNSLKTAS